MINSKYLMIGLCVSMLALAGCSWTSGYSGFAWGQRNVTLYGPFPLLDDSQSIEMIKLGPLVDSKEPIQDWDAAFAAFEIKIKDEKSEEERLRLRNQVQERILAASNQRCGEYKNFLKRFDSESNIILGGLATAIGGAGAIFKAADTARALSGIGAIFSGWRAEVNADYFNNLTIQVISKGIEARRKEIYEEILKNREKGLKDYPVQRAVGDAAVYHYNCALIAGLEHAAQSVERDQNPGLPQINKALDNLIDARKKLDTLTAKPPEKTDTSAKPPEKKDTPAKP